MASIINRISNFLNIKNNPNENQLGLTRAQKKKTLKFRIRKRTYRVDLLMKNWKTAVTIAEDSFNPRREELYRLYHSAMDDDRLLSQARTARFNVQLSPFQILVDEKEKDDLKEYFETPWFHKYLEHCVDTELWGYSLVEFFTKDNQVESIYLIPREHVRPQFEEVVIDTSDTKGIPYKEKPLNMQLVPIGDEDDLGLLKQISKLIIRKDYNISDWGRRNERFGMPFIVVKTATRDTEELDSKEKFLANFGSNGYAILDDQDEFDLKEPISATGGGHLSFKDFCNYIDDGIALLVNGQTGTSDEKAYVGSAEVHERVLNKYTLARMRRIQNHINFILFPFLVKIGYPLVNAEFQFLDLMKKDEEDPNTNTEPVKEPDDGKKKS